VTSFLATRSLAHIVVVVVVVVIVIVDVVNICKGISI
jgi:hypothetical protein